MITDRPRFIVEQANTGVILYRDLEVLNPRFGGQLSGPATLQLELSPFANPVFPWKKNGQWIHVEMEINGVRQIVLSTIVKSAVVNPESNNMQIECYGFSDYPKGKPWLENWNDIAVDPFTIVQRVWNHVQSFPNAQLGVEVYPVSSGTQMLPGYGFDGSTLVFDFFALFIRAVDFTDCADQINGLSRDIPFDYLEKSWWNEDRTVINKRLELAYPKGGVRQEHLSFVVGENVLQAEMADEKDIDPVTDVIIRGWFPGKVYNSRLTNTDMTQLRETILEEDAKINSTERAAAWAKKKLQRRTVPKYWKKIVIDPSHPNAPWGSFSLGDEILVRGFNPWYGEIALWHRVTSWAYDMQSGRIELGLKVEGAFNYDPIDYDPDYEEPKPVNDLKNGYFSSSLTNWTRVAGAWFRVAQDGFESPGCVRVECDGTTKALKSERVSCVPGEQINTAGWVSWEDLSYVAGPAFALRILYTLDGAAVSFVDIDTISPSVADQTWQKLEDTYVVPDGVNEYSVQLTVLPAATNGTAKWDNIVSVGE